MNKRLDEFFNREISWSRTDDDEFPYEATVKGEHARIRVNDFPEEPLYTLLINDAPEIDFDDWPDPWRRPSS